MGKIVKIATLGLVGAGGKVGKIAQSLSLIGVGVLTGNVALITAGLSIGASVFASKPPNPSLENADRLRANINPRGARKSVVGITALATDIRDEEFTDDQEYFHRFIVCASHKVHAINEVWFDDKVAWTSAGGTQGEFAGYLDVATVLEGSAANAINISGRMGSTRRYTGMAYIHLRYKLTGNDKKAESPFAQSITTRITIRGEGAEFYDPRSDSNVAGGSGTHDPADQSTWVWNASAAENPALQLLFYLLGYRITNPVTNEKLLAVGKGIPPERIDLESFAIAANICDESVAVIGGGTEPRYRSAGIWSEADSPTSVIDMLKSNMNADLDDVGGKLRLTIIHNDLATPVADFTEDDIIGSFQWQPVPDIDQTFNVVRGVYTDASDEGLYQQRDYPQLEIASPDGIERSFNLNLPMVESDSQAQRLGALRINRMQFGSGVFSASFKATGWRAQKNAIVRLTFPNTRFVQKLFRVVNIEIRRDGVVPLTLREESASIYDNPSLQPVPPAIASTQFDYTKGALYLGINNATVLNAIANSYTVGLDGNITQADNSGDVTVTIPAHTRNYGGILPANVIPGSATLQIGYNKTALIYYDDPTTSDTSPTYSFVVPGEGGAVAADAYASTANPHRHFVSFVNTQDSGGGGGWDGVEPRTRFEELDGKPTEIAHINQAEGAKLDSVESGANRTQDHPAGGLIGAGSGAYANNLTDLNAAEGDKLAGITEGATRGEELIFNPNFANDAEGWTNTGTRPQVVAAVLGAPVVRWAEFTPSTGVLICRDYGALEIGAGEQLYIDGYHEADATGVQRRVIFQILMFRNNGTLIAPAVSKALDGVIAPERFTLSLTTHPETAFWGVRIFESMGGGTHRIGGLRFSKLQQGATRNTGALADLDVVDAGGPEFVGQLPVAKAAPELDNANQNWGDVSGAGKPADNATVGADFGSNVSNVPPELTDGRIDAGLDASGDVKRALPSGVKIQSDLVTRGGGGGNYVGELDATFGAVAGPSGNLKTSGGASVADSDVTAPVLNADGTLSVTPPGGSPINLGSLDALQIPNGPAEGGADKTANAQITFSETAPFEVQADSASQTTTSLPLTRSIKLFKGGVQQSSGVTIGAITATAGSTASATVSGGVVQIDLDTANASGAVTVPVTFEGKTYDRLIVINRTQAPANSGGGGGAAPFVDLNWTNISTTSEVQVTDSGAMIEADANGELRFSASAGYNGNGAAKIDAEYRLNGAGAWTQAATATGNEAISGLEPDPGYVGLTGITIGSLTPNGSYEVRLTANRVSGSGALSWSNANFTVKQPD